MVYIEIKLQNVDKVERYINQLPKKLKEAGILGTREFSQTLYRSIYRNAPSFTGYLKSTMKVNNTKNGAQISIDAPYAYLLNTGFRTHPVSAATIERSLSNVGFTMYKTWSQLGIPRAEVYARDPVMSISKHEGFVEKSIQNTIDRLPEIMKRAIKKGLEF